ncbi:serine hydroxymethyltransferase [Frankia casuarinae]|nr:serine hydroxymethyltransferase [Frankia sp. CcI6]EYT92200.1 serine hydroxymethyltransferase [Frankia casuarinae]KDA45045.1 serine hydroxymethyltransferase [Frankia sp. BMG5.23]KFB06670.1 serine hydroxymethyltransferase [Frankia sp. Allo2]OAA22459.1 serine hydroxymethyltransferase [Frankia casuarinae]
MACARLVVFTTFVVFATPGAVATRRTGVDPVLWGGAHPLDSARSRDWRIEVELTTGERSSGTVPRAWAPPAGSDLPEVKVHQPPIPHLAVADPELAGLVEAEATRQFSSIRLIASENYVSTAVLEASGSVLTNKYSEGYVGRRYYEGQQVIDPIETLAVDRAKALFGVEHANVQPYSGSPANLAVYLAFAEPGDTVMGLSLPMGGHLTHGWSVSATGTWFRSVRYGVRADTGRIDLDEVRDLALAERPRIIFCGGTAIPRTIDFPGFAAIAREVGAVLVADIAHIAGLIAGGAHPSPVGHAPVISTTTHKTLRGPRGAMLLSDAEHATAIDKAVFPGLQGGPHNHTTAAIAVALREAAAPAFRDYAHAVVANARALAEALVERGFDLVTGGTDNHLILIDLTSRDIGGKPAARALDQAGIELNYNAVPFDQRRPFDPSGIRLGTAAITTRGLGVGHMPVLAGWIDDVVKAAVVGDTATITRVREQVTELTAAFPMPGFA